MKKSFNLQLVAYFVVSLTVLSSCGEKQSPDLSTDSEQQKPTNSSSLDVKGKVVDTDGKPFVGAVVSDGFTVVQTDDKGEFGFTRNRYSSFLTCSIPSDAEITTSGDYNIPQGYYQKLDSRKSTFTFTYRRILPEKRFRILAIGDPQVNSSTRVNGWKTKALPDLKQFVVTEEKIPSYGITAGDNVQNDSEYLPIIAEAYGQAGFPIFATIGNHDHDPDQTMVTDAQRIKPYESVFGPVNYSFNRGDVHIVVMDDIIFPPSSLDYYGGLEDSQIEWLRKDLSFVPKDKRVLISWHIPMSPGSMKSFPHSQDVIDLLSEFKVANIIDGHTHKVQHAYDHKVGDKVIEESAVGSTGAPWKGDYLSDGADRCYIAYEFDGTDITRRFCKCIGFENNHQMRMYRTSDLGPFVTPSGYRYEFPESVTGPEWVAANVFNHKDGMWNYEIWEDGVRMSTPVTRKTSLDPFVKRYLYVNYKVESEIGDNNHIMFFKLKNVDAKDVKVIARDWTGKEFVEEHFHVIDPSLKQSN